MNSELIDAHFAEAIQAQTFSAAQILLAQGETILFSKSYGSLRYPPAPRVNDATLFDIASLTKIIATTPLAMMAVQEGRLKLDASVQSYLPLFDRAEKITIRHLLAHNSGLPAWLPLFQETLGKSCSTEEISEQFIASINATKLIQAPGIKKIYSDLGFMLLGFIFEKIYAEKISSLFIKLIAQPCGLQETCYNPLQKNPNSSELNIAATESCPWRGKTLQGEVHDDNAFVLGGAAGHAGLFSTAQDLHRFTIFLLQTYSGKNEKLNASTFRAFVENPDGFRLGWDSVSRPQSQAGKYFSAQTIGHLAFTGCSYWLDLQDLKSIILLTNRVHPSRDNAAIKSFRPKIHDLLVSTFLS